MSPRTSSIVQIKFSFWSFEISEGILRNQKIIFGLVSFSYHRLIYLVKFTIICAFVFAYADSWLSHAAAQIRLQIFCKLSFKAIQKQLKYDLGSENFTIHFT